MVVSRWSKKGSSDDAFSRHGGKLSQAQLLEHIREMPIDSWEQQYRIKQIMKKFDDPAYIRGITREEFYQGLDDMTNDIGSTDLERIREHF